MPKKHTFHIPVMGTGFTLDTPLKVAHLGIDSVVSIVDDVLIEKMRRMLCKRFDISYKAISQNAEDFRAKRIRSYLNLLNDLVSKRFNALKNGSRESMREIRKYLDLLPDNEELIAQFKTLKNNLDSLTDLENWVDKNLCRGSIDANIMTKQMRKNSAWGSALSAVNGDYDS